VGRGREPFFYPKKKKKTLRTPPCFSWKNESKTNYLKRRRGKTCRRGRDAVDLHGRGRGNFPPGRELKISYTLLRGNPYSGGTREKGYGG